MSQIIIFNESPTFHRIKHKIVSLSCSREHILFLTSTAQMYSMGSNEFGKLGVNHQLLKSSSVPVLIESIQNVKKIATGLNHNLCLTIDGQLYSWGDNEFGQCGISRTKTLYQPTLIEEANTLKSDEYILFTSISCGNMHSACLTINGSAFTFGLGSQGQLGLNQEMIDTPTELPIKNVKQIECGNFVTLLLLSDHTTVIKCGDNLQERKEMIFKFKIREIIAKSFIVLITLQNEVYVMGKLGLMTHSTPHKLYENVDQLSVGDNELMLNINDKYIQIGNKALLNDIDIHFEQFSLGYKNSIVGVIDPKYGSKDDFKFSQFNQNNKPPKNSRKLIQKSEGSKQGTNKIDELSKENYESIQRMKDDELDVDYILKKNEFLEIKVKQQEFLIQKYIKYFEEHKLQCPYFNDFL